MATTVTKAARLQWIDDRWHLGDRGIHAGSAMEVRWPDGTWELCRIESSDHGKKLYAHFLHHGLDCCVCVVGSLTDERYQLRWPQR